MDYKAIESGKDYLAHHGVKGMKWGIRHDPERVGRAKKAVTNIGRKIVNGIRSVRSRKNARAIKSGNPYKVAKRFNKMSTSELQDAVTRVNLQRQLVNSLNQDKPQKETFVGDIKQDTKNSGRSAYRTVATGALTAGGMAMLAGVNPVKAIKDVGRSAVLKNQAETIKNQANIITNQNRINEAVKAARHVKMASVASHVQTTALGKSVVKNTFISPSGTYYTMGRIVTNPKFKYGRAIFTGSAKPTDLRKFVNASRAAKNASSAAHVTSTALRVVHSDMLVDSGKNYLQHGYKYLKKIQIGNHVRYFYTPEQLKAYYEADKKAAQVSRDVANAKIAARTKLMNIGESQETQDANNNIAGALQLYNYGRAAIQPHVRTAKLAGRSILGSKDKKTLKKRARDSLLKKRGMMTIGKLIKKLGG